jgi:hypothetical protein
MYMYCNIRFDLTERPIKTIKKKEKKKYSDIKFSPAQIDGFLPDLIPAE